MNVNDKSLRPPGVSFGAPQCSVLGHILSILYSAALFSSTETHCAPSSLLPMTHSYLSPVFPDQTHIHHRPDHGKRAYLM